MMELVTVVLLTEKAAIRHAIPVKCAATESAFGQCSEMCHLFGPPRSPRACYCLHASYLRSVFRG